MPFWKLYYHIVWATTGREPLVRPEIEDKVYEAIRNKAKALGGEVFAVYGTEDHVHLAVSVPPNVSLSKFVGEVKGSSSFHINHLPGNKYTLDWQRGYGVVSFRKDNLEQVVEYIQRQKEHHSVGKLWQTLEDCGKEHHSIKAAGKK